MSRSQINAVAPLPDKNSVSNFCTEVVLALPDCLAEGKVIFLQRYDIAGLSITVVGLCSSCLMCIASSHRSSSSGRRASTHASGLMKADGGRFDWESCVRSPGGLLKLPRSTLQEALLRSVLTADRSHLIGLFQAAISQPHKFKALLPSIVVH